MPELLVPFLVVTLLLIISPGPDMALVLRNGARKGAQGAWWTGLGCCVGNTVHATAAAVGLSATLAASTVAYTAIKIAGAAYLVWLGMQALWCSRSHFGIKANSRQRLSRPNSSVLTPPPTMCGSWRKDFHQGIMNDLLNPKIALLFITLLPQFVAVNEPRVITSIKLAAIFVLISVVWWWFFSLAVGDIGGILNRQSVRAWFERVTGVALIGLGMTVVLG